MALFSIEKGSIKLQKRINPSRFKHVKDGGARESDMEDLIVENPGLLNWEDFDLKDDIPDLLVIARQPRTANRKRADLFAVHRDGSLVVVEIKRDAEDERARREAFEFQAIRYAAASRKLDAQKIIDLFADFLRKQAEVSDADAEAQRPFWREKAVRDLCEHLSDEDQDLRESDLDAVLNPRERQKIYLVAADYEPDVTSACAWLREHDLPIACFRLRPFQIAGEVVLERERLIPPPELDDFLLDMASTEKPAPPRPPSEPRRAPDKPKRIVWSEDAEMGEASEETVSTWREVLVHAIRFARARGATLADMHGFASDKADVLRSAREIEPDFYVEVHASSEQMRGWIGALFKKKKIKPGCLTVETLAGVTFSLPE
jgi:hypothetical protein